MATGEDRQSVLPNGAAVAAMVASGIGAGAMGLLVILNELGIFVAPSLYAPAGGVTGRTTIAVVIWLVGWMVLHRRWRDRQVDASRAYVATLVLIAMGVLLTFPPVWSLM